MRFSARQVNTILPSTNRSKQQRSRPNYKDEQGFTASHPFFGIACKAIWALLLTGTGSDYNYMLPM